MPACLPRSRLAILSWYTGRQPYGLFVFEIRVKSKAQSLMGFDKASKGGLELLIQGTGQLSNIEESELC